MNQTIQVHKPKQYKCFKCGEPIIFKTGFYKKLFNLNGTAHICDEKTKENYKNSDEYKNSSSYQAYLRRLRAYWARKNNYSKYDNTKEKKESREKSRQKYDEYKRQYYNESLSIDRALEILEIVKDEFQKLNSALRWNSIRQQYRKMALKFHPDRNKEAGASQKFIEATEAYEKLESVYKI